MTIAPWFLPSILVLTLWGVQLFLPKLAVRTLPPLHLIVYSSCFFFFGVTGILMFLGNVLEGDPVGVFLAVSTGFLSTLGTLLYIFAIRHGSMTYGTVMTSLYPAVATVLAFFVLGEKLTLWQIAGIVLGVCSLVLMAGQAMIKLKNNWLLPSLGALVLWGVSAFLPKLALQRLSLPGVLFYDAVGSMLVAMLILFFMQGKLERDKKGIAIAFCISGISILAAILYYYALRLGPVATIVTITAMTPVVTLILARVFLRDKINRIQLLAIGMAMVAIALLAG
ncbi:MAG: DMT family transporter [Pseudomonadota bacterium]